MSILRYTHAHARRDLEMHADGHLPAARQSALETHLAACPDCRAYQEEYLTLEKSLGQSLNDLFQTHLPPIEYTPAENQTVSRYRA